MLDELNQFLLVIEHGTFTEAARHAHLSQPAFSASIMRLEAHFGARLLHRGPGGATPTAAGLALVPRARAALAALSEGRRAVGEVMGLSAGEVRLGAGATACTYLLPGILADYRKQHQNLRFLLREASADEILDALHRDELDLGIISKDEGEPWRDDACVLVGAPGTALEGAPYVTFRAGTGMRELLDTHFPEADVVMELGSIAAVKGSVRAGIGVALVSAAAVQHDVSVGRLVILADPRTPIHRRLSIVHRGVDRLPPAAAKLREVLLTHQDLVKKSKKRRK